MPVDSRLGRRLEHQQRQQHQVGNKTQRQAAPLVHDYPEQAVLHVAWMLVRSQQSM